MAGPEGANATSPGAPAKSLRDRRIRDVSVAVVDLEMTGLSPERDRVCEIAVVRGRVGDPGAPTSPTTFQTLCRPGVPMSIGALDCHGISDSMVAGAPAFRAVAADVLGLLDDAVVVGHNIYFDLGFLHREFDLAGVSAAPPFALDTLLMARRLFAFPKNNLAEVCAALDVGMDRAHRALSDARATWDVFCRMVELLDPHGTLTVGELSDLVDALAPNSPFRLRQQKLLKEAWAQRRTVWLDYQSTSDPTAGVIHREVAIWFVRFPKIQGWCFLRAGERVFRLDRIREVLPGSTPYEIPPGAGSRI